MGEFVIEPLSNDMESRYRDFLREYDFSPADEKVFNWYRSLPGTTMYVSMDNGKIIASGMSIPMGETGWIGAICTHMDYRGMGLGRAMTQYTIRKLRSQGAKSILLRASDEGARLYRSMGFIETGSYDNFPVETGDFDIPERKDFRKLSRLGKEHFSLDHEYTGEFRDTVLSSLSGQDGYELTNGDELLGFVYPSATNGIVGMTRNEELIPEFVSKIMHGRSGKIRTLKGTKINRYMRELGFETLDGAKRMVLGEDPVKNKNGIIGTISSSIG